MVVFKDTAPEIIEIPRAERFESLWRRGAVLGILRNILPNNNPSTPFAIERQLSDIDVTRQSDSVDLDSSKWDLAFEESSRIVTIWDTLVSLSCVYNLIAIPLPSFDDVIDLHYHLWLALNFAADLVYVSDMIFQCFISYYSMGLLKRNVKVIARKYIRSRQFILDVVAVFPTDLLLIEWRGFSLLRINRLTKCYRIFFYLSRIQMRTKWPNGVVLMKTIIPIVFIFHWNACGYFALSIQYGIEDTDRSNWAFSYEKIMDPLFSNCNWLPWHRECEFDERFLNGTKEDYIELMSDYWTNKLIVLNFTNLAKKYTLSFYWSSMTITTLGEQPEPDFSMQNTYEIMDTVIGILVFGCIMGSVAEIVRNANQYNRELRTELDMAKIFMRNRSVEPDVQNRVFNYFDYAISERRFFDDPTRSHSLTTPLRSELRYQILFDKFWKLELFRDKVSSTFLQELISFADIRLYGPSDFLCFTGDLVKEMYVVETGMLMEIRNKLPARRLTAGSSYGELSMIYVAENRNGNRHSTSVVSIGFSEVYVLPVEHFRRLLKDFPEVANELDNHTRSCLAAANLLKTDEEMRFAQRPLPPAIDLDDRLQQIRQTVRKLSLTITSQSGRFKKRRKSLNQKITRLEECWKQMKKERELNSELEQSTSTKDNNK
ncbi:Cyclic nucleotide-gated cation channel alpha-3 [Aphelenchoides besseyi]|nr:Cyclic nucleotide-gated cation channel alpha-3 [Aphelenchoides besseyi]KAI6194804.1 Cyclic nucleotide-gated cation channel alpha-3 [Aphelenchoides besseyi]